MLGYITIDKNRAARTDEVVAILAKKGRRRKSRIISIRDVYYSRTSAKRLAERIEGEKEKSRLFKKGK